MDEAIAEYREAIRLNKDYAEAHSNLATALKKQGRLDEAIAEYCEAIRINKNVAKPHNDLGNALIAKGKREEAIAEYREAIRIDKNLAEAHSNLGNALSGKGQLDEAIAEHRQAIRLRKDFAQAHNNLGTVLERKGRRDEAIAEYSEAIRIKKDFFEAHFNLGRILAAKGLLDEAIREFRATIRIRKDYADAYCYLGLTLMQKGLYVQAVDELRRGHEIGSRGAYWSLPSANWLRDAERLAQLDARLPALLAGTEQAKDSGERLVLARLCQQPHKKLYAASARWYDEAFAAQPALADDLASDDRYNAACAAALAGCGLGPDASELDAKQRARLRRQALDWLWADVEAWRRLLTKDPEKAHPALFKLLRHWQDDPDLAGVRGRHGLAKLPEIERTKWERLWQEVEVLRQRASVPPTRAAPIRANQGSQRGQPDP